VELLLEHPCRCHHQERRCESGGCRGALEVDGDTAASGGLEAIANRQALLVRAEFGFTVVTDLEVTQKAVVLLLLPERPSARRAALGHPCRMLRPAGCDLLAPRFAWSVPQRAGRRALRSAAPGALASAAPGNDRLGLSSSRLAVPIPIPTMVGNDLVTALGYTPPKPLLLEQHLLVCEPAMLFLLSPSSHTTDHLANPGRLRIRSNHGRSLLIGVSPGRVTRRSDKSIVTCGGYGWATHCPALAQPITEVATQTSAETALAISATPPPGTAQHQAQRTSDDCGTGWSTAWAARSSSPLLHTFVAIDILRIEIGSQCLTLWMGIQPCLHPLDEERGGFLVVMAQNEVEARERLRHDPWYAHDILSLVWVKRRRIFIDTWETTSDDSGRGTRRPGSSGDDRSMARVAGLIGTAEELP
jgi:hypothetical protein